MTTYFKTLVLSRFSLPSLSAFLILGMKFRAGSDLFFANQSFFSFNSAFYPQQVFFCCPHWSKPAGKTWREKMVIMENICAFVWCRMNFNMENINKHLCWCGMLNDSAIKSATKETAKRMKQPNTWEDENKSTKMDKQTKTGATSEPCKEEEVAEVHEEAPGYVGLAHITCHT